MEKDLRRSSPEQFSFLDQKAVFRGIRGVFGFELGRPGGDSA